MGPLSFGVVESVRDQYITPPHPKPHTVFLLSLIVKYKTDQTSKRCLRINNIRANV